MTTTITALTAASALAGTDITAVDQSGTTKKASMTQIAAFIGASPLAVDDGSTTVSAVTAIHFSSGATVSSGGAGIADIAIAGGGGGGGGSPTFSGCSVRNSADVSCASGVGTNLTWDTEDYDTDAYHDTGTNPSRLTAPLTGYYAVSVSTRPNSGSPSAIYYTLKKNGTGVAALSFPAPGMANGGGVSIAWEGHLTAGDYMEFEYFPTGGTTLTDHLTTQFAMSLRGFSGARVSGASIVSALPASPTQGDRAFVTDATATTFLSTVAGGGSDKVPVVYDGTNWVIG
jgi:hypothetical protein